MKRLNGIITIFLLTTSLFAQSEEYKAYMKEAKQYEEKKQWAFAMSSYYDAILCNESSNNKFEAYKAYEKLSYTIKTGNPGFGKFNAFTKHDEWKRLLIDAEQLGSSLCQMEFKLGFLEQESLDYVNRTATYTAQIDFDYSWRFEKIIEIIIQGYKEAYKKDWIDLPEPDEWPTLSVSHSKDGIYNENGALLFCFDGIYYNAPFVSYCDMFLYDCKLNIVDENGKELVKGKRYLLGSDNNTITFTGITPDVMELIDNDKAFINLQEIYLEYGAYNENDDTGGRLFIKHFPEEKMPLEKVEIYGWNKWFDPNKAYFILTQATYFEHIVNEEINNKFNEIIPETNYKFKVPENKRFAIGKTEVTQNLYEAIIGENPSDKKGDNFPVVNVSLYDAIYFCNKLSEKMGFEPAYALDGKTNVMDWDYIPNNGNEIKGSLSCNLKANGFRLPNNDEWTYAAKGGNYNFYYRSGQDSICWNSDNTKDDGIQEVGQKWKNGYGLFDMFGNVSEWICEESITWMSADAKGGSILNKECTIESSESHYPESRFNHIGFRILVPIQEYYIY